MNGKTYTSEQIAEAFAAVRRDIDSTAAGTENDSERGRFGIGDVETDVLTYLRGAAGWMSLQDEAAQQAYRRTAGLPEDGDDQRDEDEYFYNGEIAVAVDRWER